MQPGEALTNTNVEVERLNANPKDPKTGWPTGTQVGRDVVYDWAADAFRKTVGISTNGFTLRFVNTEAEQNYTIYTKFGTIRVTQ